jgi:hypothetical protein
MAIWRRCIRIVQPAVQISIQAAGQKRPTIVVDRRFIQRKAAVRPIAWRHAKRHQAPGDEKFREYRRPDEIVQLLPGKARGLQLPHVLAVVADRAGGAEFAHARGVGDRLAGPGVRVSPQRVFDVPVARAAEANQSRAWLNDTRITAATAIG